MTRARAVGWSLVAVAALAACAPSAADEAFARIAIVDVNADFRERAVGDFIHAEDGQALDEGDEVRTDETGFAEIEYADGSLTRLDTETRFRVRALGGDAAVPEIGLELEEGRSWHRVREVTARVGSFAVDTPVGVASVRGTAFSIDCEAGGPCTFDVTEGQVVLARDDGTEVEIDAGESATADVAVVPDGEIERTGIDPTLTSGDGWIARNVARDDDADVFGGDDAVCSAALAGQNLNRASSPSTAVFVAADDEDVTAIGAALEPVTAIELDLRLGPFSLPAAEDDVSPPDQRFRTAVDVADYAVFGVGLYQLEGRAVGPGCTVLAYVRVGGRFPLATVAGAVALVLTLLGGGLAVRARVKARRSARVGEGRGHRVQGLVWGGVAGLGVAVLLQQFAVLVLSLALLAGGLALGAAVGLLLGWPAVTAVGTAGTVPPDLGSTSLSGDPDGGGTGEVDDEA